MSSLYLNLKSVISYLSRGLVLIALVCHTGISEAREKLVLWEHPHSAQAIEKIARKFEELYDCEIDIRGVSIFDQVDRLLSQKSNDDYPDIISMLSDNISFAYEMDLLSPIRFMQFDANSYTTYSINTVCFDGVIYAVPISLETQILFYNKELLDEPFLTFDEYIDYSATMMSQGIYCLLANWKNFYTSYGVIAGYGGYIWRNTEEDNFIFGDYGLENEGTVRAIQFLRSMYEEGIVYDRPDIHNSFDEYNNLFKEGKAVAIINGQWAINEYNDAKLDFGIACLPLLPNGAPMSAFINVKAYGITRYSKHHDLAEKFLQFINEEENAIERYKTAYQITPTSSFLSNEYVNRDPVIHVLSEQMVSGSEIPVSPDTRKLWKFMDNALDDIFSDKVGIAKALRIAHQSFRREVKSKKNN